MRVYSGNVTTAPHLALCREHGWGRMISAVHWRTPLPDLPWAFDNGAWSAHRCGKELDLARFAKQYRRIADVEPPDFAVVPDKVGAGFESLRFSLLHVDVMWWGVPSYLAVQDGMTPEEVAPALQFFNGLFVGGTTRWKWATLPRWVRLAHNHGLPCHVGRAGTTPRIRQCLGLGVDSIDSTSWTQNDTHHFILDALDAGPLPLHIEQRLSDYRCGDTIDDPDLGLAVCRQALGHDEDCVHEPYYEAGAPPILARDRGPHLLLEIT